MVASLVLAETLVVDMEILVLVMGPILVSVEKMETMDLVLVKIEELPPLVAMVVAEEILIPVLDMEVVDMATMMMYMMEMELVGLLHQLMMQEAITGVEIRVQHRMESLVVPLVLHLLAKAALVTMAETVSLAVNTVEILDQV